MLRQSGLRAVQHLLRTESLGCKGSQGGLPSRRSASRPFSPLHCQPLSCSATQPRGLSLKATSERQEWHSGHDGPGASGLKALLTGLGVGSSLLLLKVTEASHRAESEASEEVMESETGIKFRKSITMPPFVESKWRGSRPGFVYRTGNRGTGYYYDTHLGGTLYSDVSETGIQQHLVGVGMRCMLQRCDIHLARAYAIGLYTDKSFLENGQPKPINSGGTRKTLKLIMAREVKGGHMAKGFDRTLIPMVREKTGMKQGPGKEALKTFTQAFYRTGLLQVGAEVDFYFDGHDNLTIFIEQLPAAKIKSAVLCEAVMDMYVGARPVGPQIKLNLVEGYSRAASELSTMPLPPGTAAV